MNRIVSVAVTPTITASSAYTSGNALGGLINLSNLCLGGQSTILSLAITDKANQKAAVDILLFSQTFTATADKSAVAISSADLLNMIGSVSVATGDYATVGTGAVATKGNLQIGCVSTVDNNLYAQLVVRGTPTYASTSDIQLKVYADVIKGN